MRSKKELFKIGFFVTVLVVTFIFIYWYTGPSRCNSSYNGELKGKYGDSAVYDMCTNYYGLPIFKDKDKALVQAKEDYREAVDVIEEVDDFSYIDESNYEKVIAYALKLDVSDDSIDRQARDFAGFLDIYGNSLKRAKPYLECIFTKTFYAIDILENYENNKDYNYVILMNPDTSEPMMVKLTNDIKTYFIEGEYLEVSFVNDKDYKGSYSDYPMLFEKLVLKEIRITDRRGSEQLQENGCR